MPYCRNCGAELSDQVAFCSKCGTPAKVPHNGPAINLANHPNTYQQVMYIKPKIPGRGFGISSMVLGIIGLVYAFAAVINSFTILDSMYSSGFYRYNEDELYACLTMTGILTILPILSLSFAPAAFKRGYKNGVSISGLVMGLIGLIGFTFAFFHFLSYIR